MPKPGSRTWCASPGRGRIRASCWRRYRPRSWGVVPRPEAAVTLEEIVAYLRNVGIATFKLPERLEIRDALPRNPLGKILKRELRDELRH